MADFKLSAQLVGHNADVRHVCFPAPDLILSAARDCTVRAWKRTSTSPPTFESTVATKGTEFYNSLTYLSPSPDYPDGLVVSAGSDTIIDVRKPTSAPNDNAERLLIGHARNICALAVIPGCHYLVSGSWDKTARIWNLQKWELEAILSGHEEAVWDVLPLDKNTIVTASADKNIRIYDVRTAVAAEIQPKSTIYTSDVVRALCQVPPGHPSGADFASASNDGVIRLWKLNGQQVGELRGHESFIYSLAALPSGELVSSGEDRTVRIWRGSDCLQTITHPAISVWSVSVCSESGDIVTGTSDGVARVFSRSRERLASPDTIAHFDESVRSSSIPQQQVGSVNKEKLPGPDFLKNKSGTKEGQVQMIREEDSSVTAHQWSMSQQQWVNVGTVVDAVGSSGRKVEYNGQSYDYVFDVAIEEGQPSLKLPYNLSENPYTRAQKFIDDNELSQNFLDQVAQFIISNTQGATIGQDIENGGGSGPYGTESRYRPGDDSSASSSKALPQREYLDITAAKYDPIFKKILSINSGLEAAGRKDHSLNPPAQGILATVKQRLETNQPVGDEASINLVAMMCTRWDYSDRLAPLDLLRCIATSSGAAKFKSSDFGSLAQIAISAALEGVLSDGQPNEHHVMMAARTIANLFGSTEGRKLLGQSSEGLATVSFIDRVLGIGGQPAIGPFNRNLQVALTTVMVNFGVLASREPGKVPSNVQVRLLTALAWILQKQTEGEVIFRALVAAGTLITVIGKYAPEARSMSSSIASSKDRVSEPRVKQMADECLSLLK
ncbi:PFU-domain-containing protein [Annulohypoxylon maeteangense]|uniref:PFU-domain-containing protein n=1 Tax=Annulohypoxylon maeteangense TaxID=1927788 RepID=UPI0020078091|nr:PFU-domain-containing protein [Annulohypoxylon maeteangense]KAI0886454.1 PFU-domain-containing protein [Annulohypoxylon maeteangense]